MLKGEDLAEEDEEESVEGLDKVFKEVPPIEYNPAIPIETFDIIVTDECHRSIYNLWRQVLEYFDAYHRPYRHAQQADLRLLQSEPRDGIRP